MWLKRSLIVLICALLNAACEANRSPLAPTAQDVSSPSSNGQSATVLTAAVPTLSMADVSGTWTWDEEVKFMLPQSVPEAIADFGITPDGPVTHVTCHDSGMMTLVQNRATFSGSATQAGTCRTRGGQLVAAPFPSLVNIVDGTIDGRSVHFLFGSDDFSSCPYMGMIADVDAGIAVELRASGRCIAPGHPQNPVPVDPPPVPNKTVTWQARRP